MGIVQEIILILNGGFTFSEKRNISTKFSEKSVYVIGPS